MKEMIGGCCVCSDESGWDENPLVYCDGEGCNVAVHQACYGIVSVPPGPWFCRKCESQERTARVRCELCPGRGGALKRTDTGGWAHVVCALYIPEVRFGDVSTMEPILVSIVPPDRFNKVCCLCELQGRASRSGLGACMSCNKAGCRQSFHVTCAQGSGLLCEEQVQSMNNVTYCGYCPHHYAKLQKRGHSVKPIPAFRPSSVAGGPVATPDSSPEKQPLRPSSVAAAAAGVVEPRRHKRVRSSRSPRSAGGSASEAELAVTTSNDAWSDARVKSEASPPPPLPTNGNGDDANKFTTANFTETVVRPSGSVFGRTADDTSAPGGGAESESTLSTTSDVDAKPVDRCPSAPDLLVIKQEPAGGDASIGGATPSITAPSIPVAVSLTTHPPRSSPGVAPAVMLAPASSDGVEMDLSQHTAVGQQSVHVSSAPPTPTAAGTAVPDAVAGQPPTPQVSPRLLVSAPSAAAAPVVSGGAIFSEVSQSAAAVVASVQSSAAASAAVSQSSAAPMPSAIVVPTAVAGNKGKRPRVAGAAAGEARKRKPPGRPRKHLSAAGLDDDAVTDLTTTSTAGSADHMLDTSNSAAAVYNAAARNSGGGAVVRGQNGAVSSYTMLGNQLNPSSAMAQQLGDSLAAEIEDQGDQQLPGSTAGAAQLPTALVGPPLPGGARFSQSRGAAGGVGTFPQSLSELLERQWEQGSQFLMEQAQHFDISALLSCLYQLRRENDQLEEHMLTLSQRRDHLLAVHARLSVPLEGITTSSAGHPPASAAPARPVSGQAAPPSAPPQPSRHVQQQLVSPRNLTAAGGGGGMENGVLPQDHPLHVHPPHPHQQQQQHHLQQQQQMVHGVGGRLLNRTSPSSSQSAGVRDRIAAASAVRTTSSLSYMSAGAVGGNNAMAVPLIVNTSSALQQQHHHHHQQQHHHHHSLQQSAAVGARVMAHPVDHRDHRLMESLRVSAADAAGAGVGSVYPQYQMVSPPTPAASLHHVVHMPPPLPAPGSLPPAGHQSHPPQQHRHRLDKR